MLSVISFIAGMCAHTPIGVLLHVLDLSTAETQEAVAVYHRGAEDTIKGNSDLKRCPVTQYHCFLPVPSASSCANT